MSYVVLLDPVQTGLSFKKYVIDSGNKIISIYTMDENLYLDTFHISKESLTYNDSIYIFSNDEDDIIEQISPFLGDIIGFVPCFEASTHLAPRLANRLGVVGNTPALGFCCRDKYEMRKRVASCGFRQPKFVAVSAQQYRLSLPDGFEYPVIVKTPRGAATHHVFVCHGDDELFNAYEIILNDRNVFGEESNIALVEEYIQGNEIVVDTFSDASGHRIVGYWDYTKIDNEYSHNLYHSILGRTDDRISSNIRDYIFGIIESVGVSYGMCHIELMITDHGPYLIEIGARLPGWGMPELYRHCSNFDPWLETFNVFTVPFYKFGPDIKFHAHPAMAICPTVSNGTVQKIIGMEEIRQLDSYVTHSLKIDVGDLVSPSINLIDSPLEVCLANSDQVTLMQDMAAVHSLFGVETHCIKEQSATPA